MSDRAATVDFGRAWDGPLRPGTPGPEPFGVVFPGGQLAGEELGDGPPVVLAHGLSAARRYVLHGSRVLPRRGHRAIAYDARGHGESDPAGEGAGYDYSELAGDLGAVIEARAGNGRVLLVGHSMGAHTVAAYSLGHADRVAGIVMAGPVSVGGPAPEESERYWESLAAALEEGGPEGFARRVAADASPDWRERIERFTRERMSVHRHPAAVARALREVPRASPFDDLAELEFLEVPALVVASHDLADPGHPHSVAEAWAERLPEARLVSEDEDSAPLTWQGGRLSREIAAFFAEPPVRRRLEA